MCPVVAIGGITQDNVPSLIAAGADAVAVITAVFDAPDVEAAARAIAGASRRQPLRAVHEMSAAGPPRGRPRGRAKPRPEARLRAWMADDPKVQREHAKGAEAAADCAATCASVGNQ